MNHKTAQRQEIMLLKMKAFHNRSMTEKEYEMLEKIRLDTIRIFNEMKLFENDITVDMLREKLTTVIINKNR